MKKHICPMWGSVPCFMAKVEHLKELILKNIIQDFLCFHKWHIGTYADMRYCRKCGKVQVPDDYGMTWRNKKGGE